MNSTKHAKRVAILDDIAELAFHYGVPEPMIVFDKGENCYWPNHGIIWLAADVYTKVGRTVIYHEFVHHLRAIAQWPSMSHDGVFWATLHQVVTKFDVEYPWTLEYQSGVRYYERHIVPNLSARARTRAIKQAAEYQRLSQAA